MKNKSLATTKINTFHEVIKDLDDHDFKFLLNELCQLKQFFCSDCKHRGKINHNDYTLWCDQFNRKTTEHSRGCNDFARRLNG